MNTQASKNASFQLPFQFDPTLLLQDLEICMGYGFLGNYIPSNYDGDKYILPLRSIDGKMDHGVAVQGATNQFKNTEALEKCTYFQEVIKTFECQKESIRIMSLPAGATINRHVDYNSGYEDGVFRIHIPIKTNDQVKFLLENRAITMRPGEAWYTNISLPHGVINEGKTERIHLVLDGIRNAWSDTLFGSVGYDFEEESRQKTPMYSKETMERMIEELSAQDSEASRILIADLQKQLNTKEE